jgi:hypothetical protein
MTKKLQRDDTIGEYLNLLFLQLIKNKLDWGHFRSIISSRRKPIFYSVNGLFCVRADNNLFAISYFFLPERLRSCQYFLFVT